VLLLFGHRTTQCLVGVHVWWLQQFLQGESRWPGHRQAPPRALAATGLRSGLAAVGGLRRSRAIFTWPPRGLFL